MQAFQHGHTSNVLHYWGLRDFTGYRTEIEEVNMDWTHTVSVQKETYKELCWRNRKGKGQFRRLRRRWDDTTKMDLGMICCENKRWMEVA
jgi:hypothetical protein